MIKFRFPSVPGGRKLKIGEATIVRLPPQPARECGDDTFVTLRVGDIGYETLMAYLREEGYIDE